MKKSFVLNVGIGTTTPSGKLSVDAGAYNLFTLSNTGLTTMASRLELYTNGANTRVFDAGISLNTEIQGYNDGQFPVILQKSGGSVGIGTSTPTVGTRLDITGTGTAGSSIIVPRDTTANRPAGAAGMIRYNTTLNKLEVYENGGWVTAQGAGSKWRQSANFTTTSTTYVDVTSAEVSIDALVGDIVHLRVSCGLSNSGGANSTFARVIASAGHTATIAHDVGVEHYFGGTYFDYNYVNGTEYLATGTVVGYTMGDYDITVGTGGVVSFKLQARATAGTATIQNCVIYIEKK